MTAVATPSRLTFRDRVAACFTNRPTIRDVLSHEGFQSLVDRYPWIRRNHPHITTLDDFIILHPSSGPGESASPSGMLDMLLEHFLTNERLQLAATDQLSVSPPQVFRIQEQGQDDNRQPEITVDLAKLNGDFDSVLDTLVSAFQQAQIGFWNGLDEDSQVSRVVWMEHTIKAALLENLPRQGLDKEAKAAVYPMLMGISGGLTIEAVQVTLGADEGTHTFTLPDLLLSAHEQVLQCKPCGSIRKHADLPSFTAALQTELAQRHDFASFTWAHTPVVGRPFAFQARQLLNGILDDIGRLQVGGVATIDDLERQLRQVSDPSRHFLNQPEQDQTAPTVSPPAWLANASGEDRYTYHAALLDLAADQGGSQGATSLGDIEDIHRYTARRLREQLQASYPGKTVHDPDKVIIHISQSIVGNIPQGQSLPLRTQSLTELAIARLRLEAGEAMSGISIGEGSPVQDWLNIEQVRDLIHQVDIGGQYPAYLQDKVKAEPRRTERIRQHASEWRSTLRFSVLQAKIEGRLGEPASRSLLDFCQGSASAADTVHIAPLAFHCAPGASTSDRAHGMFVFELPACSSWVLYRPFYVEQAVREFAALEALMAAIRDKGELQDSILAWLDDEARPVYENDGFNHPHLHPNLTSLLHLISAEGVFLDSLLQRLSRPVQPSFQTWTAELDTHLFNARVDTMLLAAASTSVSNAQEKRALVKEAAWALFNTVTQLWHGPLVNLTWLVLALSAAKQDLQALLDGNGDHRIVAATDLLTNLALLLAHRNTPPAGNDAAPATLRFSGPVQKGEFAARALERPVENTWDSPVEAPPTAPTRVQGWHDDQRLANLTVQQRQALSKLQARQSLEGHLPLGEGRLRGLYKIAERHYAKLGDGVYEVIETWNGMQIIGPDQSDSEWSSQWRGSSDGYHIVGRERPKGPWLTRWNGKWALNLNLAGGMPRNRQTIRAENLQRFNELKTRAEVHEQALSDLRPLMELNRTQLQAYDDLALAYSLALDALPAHERAAPPEPLQVQKQALKAMREQHLPQLRASALYLERQSTALHANIEAFKEMAEPRFGRLDPRGRSQRQYGAWYETALDNDMLLCRRLLEQVDHQALAAQAVGLQRFPQTPEEIEQYITYRELVGGSSNASRRLLAVSERLDRSIPEALQDPSVDFPDKEAKLAETIRRRTYSTLVVRAQLLSDLAYLVVDKTLLTADSAEYLLTMRSPLSDAELSRMIWSHDGLAASEATAQEKTELLEDILKKYLALLDRARYMQILDDPALVAGHLEAYIGQLSAITQNAEQQLSDRLANLDDALDPPPPAPVHHSVPARRRVIRTARGRPLLVEVEQGGERAVQRDPFDQQPLGNFAQRNGEWHQEPDPVPPAQHDRGQLRQRANRLLSEVEGKIAFAAHYADEPNSLSDFLDWPVEDMGEVRQLLATFDNPQDNGLLLRLQEAVQRVEQEQRRLLTDAYLNTRHPDGKALRYLAGQNRVRIAQSVSRRRLRRANDYLDVYEIRDVQALQNVLWEAHFHYSSVDADPHEFLKGHLKFWDVGVKGRDAMLEQAANARERIAIYRGDLRLEQVLGIIPFPEATPH